jgi:hypothetical protein
MAAVQNGLHSQRSKYEGLMIRPERREYLGSLSAGSDRMHSIDVAQRLPDEELKRRVRRSTRIVNP